MRQTRYDSIPIREGDRLAQFVNGGGAITPAAAYTEWTGEGESAAAARARMIDRHSRTHSVSAAEGRERMIQKQGKRE